MCCIKVFFRAVALYYRSISCIVMNLEEGSLKKIIELYYVVIPLFTVPFIIAWDQILFVMEFMDICLEFIY